MERWLIRLSIYDFEIRYKPGKENVVADWLSRLPDENLINENEQDDYLDNLVAAVETTTDIESNIVDSKTNIKQNFK